MATAYHRRPRPSGLDIAAVAHNKIGSGSAWQGYYMYVGGMNPSGRDHSYAGGLQESHDTGYPNDLPRFDYDFHAPIGASGRLSSSHSLLRRQHAFFEAFGSSLGPMESTLPHVPPTGVDDVSTLRWALRSDGRSGFVFITWHQPHVLLDTYEDAHFEVTVRDGRTLFPLEPVDIPPGTIAHWPVSLFLDGVELEWATASALTTLRDGARSVLVLTAEHDIPLTWKWADDVVVTPYGDRGIDASTGPGTVTRIQVYRCSTPTMHIDVVVLPANEADQAWVLGFGADRQLVLSEHPVWREVDGMLHGRTTAPVPDVRRYQPSAHAFVPVGTRAVDTSADRRPLAVTLVRPASEVPISYGGPAGRGSAPTQTDIRRSAAVYRIDVPPRSAAENGRRELEIDWTGDVAQLMLDDTVVADRFWDGSTWIVDPDELGAGAAGVLTMMLLPMNPDHTINLPAEAREASPRSHQQDPPSVGLVIWQQWVEYPKVS